ncbi:MAG: hypothetical protein F4Z30_02380 [Gemmatimonadetes bacterium]|nr:hypothetical protein [Gemmatimonadota bacterium]
MNITLTSDLERMLTEQARKLGITPEQLVVDSLKERFTSASAVPKTQGTLADFLHEHIGVLDSREYIPSGACMSEDNGKKFAAGLLK